MRKKIAPAEKISKMIKAAMNGIPEGDAKSLFFRLAAQKVAQELLEAEQRDFLGRERYERKSKGQGLRNGYEPKKVKTAEGGLVVQVPQVRQSLEPFRSKVAQFLVGHSGVLERLAIEMYARGLSTRDIDDAFLEATGKRLLSKSGVSEVTEELWKDFNKFQKRDLSHLEVECLFLDAVYESIRLQSGLGEGILCAWGILRDGRKVLIHVCLGNKESYAAWLSMLRDMVARGLRIPLSVTSDGAPGLIKAIKHVFPRSVRIHCWFHKMQNIVQKLPSDALIEVKAHLIAVREAPTFELGEARAQDVLRRYRKDFPSAMASFESDLQACLNHLKLPVRLRKQVRTTNLIERSFLEERRRTKVIPRFFNEKSCLKLVFATLWRASSRWQRIAFSGKDLEQIDELRKRLKINVKNQDYQRHLMPLHS
jgi:putative transposase